MTEGWLPGKEKEPRELQVQKFLARYQNEVMGLFDKESPERELVQRLSEDHTQTLSREEERMLDDIIEQFETKIFEFTKSEAPADAKRVLVTSDNPGSWTAMGPLIAALDTDPRCKGVVAVVSGVAGKEFKKKFPRFNQVHDEKMVLEDALTLANNEPIDVAIGSVSVQNGPEDLALFGGKGNLGAAQNYFVFEGYGGVGGAFKLGTAENMEKIDGIFCNDAFAKAIIHKRLPDYPLEQIFVTGMLAADSFELSKAEDYRTETRATLGIASETFTALYLGDASSDYDKTPGENSRINIDTFEETMQGMRELAQDERAEPIALIVRPHPRAGDKVEFMKNALDEVVPENLSIKDGSGPVKFEGAIYASDVVMSINSNENIFAPVRGRRSIILAYDGEKMGGPALKEFYGDELLKAMREIPGIYYATNPHELAEILKQISKEPLPEPTGTTAVTAGILDKVLA